MKKYTAAKLAIVGVAALTLTLASCANSQHDSDKKVDTATQAQSTSTKSSTSAQSNGVTLVDGYVKAKPADSEMTGMFGKIHNGTDKAVTVTSFTTNLGASKYEIHEVVNGTMQEKQGGLQIPAGGDYELKPGGDHLMIMGLKKEIAAGDTVKVTIKLADGTEVKDIELPVRTIASGKENYGSNGQVQGDSGMTTAPSMHMNHG